MLHIINFISEYRMYIMPVFCAAALAAVVCVIKDLWKGFKEEFLN
jgi:hypothetical protein